MSDATTAARAWTNVPCVLGHFNFADVHTSDVDGAQAFYATMFGWQYVEIPGAPNRYVTAGIDGRSKAAITGLTDEQRAAGVPPYWLPYLWVDDCDAAYARVGELGGTCVAEPMDIFEYGRMALLQDPTGAWLGLWQDFDPDATIVKDEHGSPFWFELHTSDVDRALEFYGELVGWTSEPQQMGPEMVYHLMVAREPQGPIRHAGGIMRQMQQDLDAGRPSQWFVYLQVDDCDAAFATAQEHGAAPVMEPHDIPAAGRSCWITDPQGAYLAMMSPDPEQG